MQKIVTWGKKLAYAKKLVGQQADNLHKHASETNYELFIPELKKHRAEANRGAGRRPPRRPFVGIFCSLVKIL